MAVHNRLIIDYEIDRKMQNEMILFFKGRIILYINI